MLKLRTAAISAAAVIGLAVLAGAQVPAKPDSAHRGMDRGGRHGDMRGMRHGGMRHGGMRGQRGFGGEGRLMKDLNLTDAQKSRIKAIHEKFKPQYKTLREQGKTQFESLRSTRQKGDTSAAARQRFRQQREQFRQRADALRTQERNEIRAVLTADQRAKWDAAAKQREERFKQRQERMGQRRGARSKA
jgi:Spy/CpxP family protein refolding chaperone